MMVGFDRTHHAELAKNSQIRASFSVTGDTSPFTDESQSTNHGGSSAEYNLDFTFGQGVTDALTPVGSNTGFTLNWTSQSSLMKNNSTDITNISSAFTFNLTITSTPATVILQKMAMAGSNYDGASLAIYDSSGTNLLHQATSTPATTVLQTGSYMVKFNNDAILATNGSINSSYQLMLQVQPADTGGGPQIPEPHPISLLGLGATTLLMIRRRTRLS